jgi:excisionase family DNA binding protein
MPRFDLHSTKEVYMDSTTTSERLLLRPAEAAEVLGIGRATLYALVLDGSIPSVRIGRSRRISVEALRRWVEAREAAAFADR